MAPWPKALIAAAALAGCAPLTAEAPLFSPADQIGPAPLAEGVWVQISEECTARMARRRGRLPAACVAGELRRQPDGAWLFSARIPAREAEPARDLALRMIIAPASETPNWQAYAPLYVAEYASDETAHPGPRYAVIAPIGRLPATEIFVIGEIGCADVLRDGPVEGVREVRDEADKLIHCMASSQAAVRAAARRALIENLARIDETRLLFVRP